MLYKKGQSGNKRGRPTGSKNRVTQQFRDAIAERVSLDDLFKDIAKCSARDRAQLKIRLLEFCVPKLRSIEVNDLPVLGELLQMTPDERKARLLELLKNGSQESEG